METYLAIINVKAEFEEKDGQPDIMSFIRTIMKVGFH